ncbi:lycopene cyclase domain-containing protein [Sphingobacterium anhuiense]|uniref:Lycopene cyclase domain-containing protein n=1 Tax=Sphingobacterium anhuiense TaxID=493780 RepID=A0ABW5Z132_9SPHI
MVNGVLIGNGLESPIVNYNMDQILNIRILTILVEDAVYGYTQFMLNIYFFKQFQKVNDRNLDNDRLISDKIKQI